MQTDFVLQLDHDDAVGRVHLAHVAHQGREGAGVRFPVVLPRVESTSTDLPSVIWARGNRSWLAFTQGGAKLESPFFQLANQSQRCARCSAGRSQWPRPRC